MERRLTIPEAAERLDCSNRTVRDWCKSGKIKARIVAGKYLIPEEEVDRLLGGGTVTEFPPLGELLGLLQRWREQIQFWSLDELLRKVGLEASRKDRLPGMTEWVAKIYHAAKRQHSKTNAGPLKVSLSIEQEGLFHQLGQCLLDDPIWKAQECWDLTCGGFLEAFLAWHDDIGYEFQLDYALALREGLREQGREVAGVIGLFEQLKKEDPNWSEVLRLATVVISCDLLTLGIRELESDPRWFFHVDKLNILRGEAVNRSLLLAKDFWLTQGDIGVVARLLWDHEPKVREDTKSLLQKLQNLQAAQDDLRSKLTVLERRLYNAAKWR